MITVSLSDLHTNFEPLNTIDLAGVDLLAISGDVCCIRNHLGQGKSLEELHEIRLPQLKSCNSTLAAIQREFPNLVVGFCPGNHDPGDLEVLQQNLTAAEVLVDSGMEITSNGKKCEIWGTPWQACHGGIKIPEFSFVGWEHELEAKYAVIPDSTDVLLSHSPAYGVLDERKRGDHQGSRMLKKRINELGKLALQICGHVHEGYGSKVVERYYNKTPLPPYLAVNASLQKIDFTEKPHSPLYAEVTWSDEFSRWSARPIEG